MRSPDSLARRPSYRIGVRSRDYGFCTAGCVGAIVVPVAGTGVQPLPSHAESTK
jgi:hypothetical protein